MHGITFSCKRLKAAGHTGDAEACWGRLSKAAGNRSAAMQAKRISGENLFGA